MTNTLLFIGLSLAVALVNRALKKRGIPVAPVNMLLGTALGPLWFNFLSADKGVAIMMELAVILLLFSAGLGLHWRSFRQAIRPGISVGISGIVLSIVLGAGLTYLLNARADEALFVGVALAATSVGISVQVLEQYGVLNSRVGRILLAAAVVDDIIALYLMSSLHAGLYATFSIGKLLLTMSGSLIALCALATVLLWCAKNAHRVLLLRRSRGHFSYHLLFVLAGAGITHLLGLSSIVGAFLAGVCLAIGCDNHDQHKKNTRTFHQLSEWLSPLFFIGIGVQLVTIDIGNTHLLLLTAGIFIAAVVGKLFTPWIIHAGLSQHQRWLLGISLLPRGEVGLIVASTGYQMGHLDDHTMFALILMAILTALLPPLGIAWLMKRQRATGQNR